MSGIRVPKRAAGKKRSRRRTGSSALVAPGRPPNPLSRARLYLRSAQATRQRAGERRSFGLGRANVNATTVRIDNELHNVQAQPKPLIRLSIPHAPAEGLEQHRYQFGGN